DGAPTSQLNRSTSQPKGGEMIIDTASRTTPHLTCLKQRGVDTIIRYYCHGDSGKKLRRDEAEAIIAGRMSIGVVYQNNARSPAFLSPAIGTAHGTEAAQY